RASDSEALRLRRAPGAGGRRVVELRQWLREGSPRGEYLLAQPHALERMLRALVPDLIETHRWELDRRLDDGEREQAGVVLAEGTTRREHQVGVAQNVRNHAEVGQRHDHIALQSAGGELAI